MDELEFAITDAGISFKVNGELLPAAVGIAYADLLWAVIRQGKELRIWKMIAILTLIGAVVALLIVM
jgi:hypothetical protein